MYHFKIILWLISGVSALQGEISDKMDSPLDFEEKWFEQYLDHFSLWDNTTFPMRYFEVNEFFQHGGPLLLEIGGEVTIDSSTLSISPSYALAKRLHAKLVLLEHRYYGKSAPFENASTTDYIYLNVEQALEDIAYFIETYTNTTPGLQYSRVAVFGCSYAGTLATWARYKFPHLINAAWASSAPVKIALDFYQYYEVAGELYSNVSSECIAIIRQGYRETKTMLATPEGLEKVRSVFEDWECGNVTEMVPSEILATIRLVLADQYNKPNHGVKGCEFLQSKNSTTTCFEQLAAFVLSTADAVCFDDDVDDVMAWTYQTCTQFGYSFTTSSRNQPFKDEDSVIESDMRYCSETFGEEFNLDMLQRNIARTNRIYGATNLKVTKVVTIQGKQDPWHRVGLQRQTNEDAPVFLVPDASHCADMSKVDYKPELPQLAEAKRQACNLIIKWLQ